MAEILSQKEIDELIASLAAPGSASVVSPKAREPRPAASAGTAAEGRERRVRVYDFRRPDKFSKEQLRTLSMIHDNFARLLTTVFSGHFRSMVSVSVASVDDLTYAEFIRSIANPSVLTVFSLPPLKGNAVMDINPSIAFPMIDRIFGGPGNKLDKARPLTEIEGVVMERLSRGFLESLAEAWHNIAEFKPQVEGIEANPLFTQVVPPNEIVVSVSLDTRIGDNQGTMTLCLPYMVIEPVLPKLSAHNWFASSQRDAPTMSQGLQKRLAEARIPLTAYLGQARIKVRDLLALQRGDVIPLNS
ncbi:MAG: flagellar motor switch protein FliM, partial [Actinobacteria bacterium]|nr:flagellar motor switch protein FliM [Actinomycetota bacterium]